MTEFSHAAVVLHIPAFAIASDHFAIHHSSVFLPLFEVIGDHFAVIGDLMQKRYDLLMLIHIVHNLPLSCHFGELFEVIFVKLCLNLELKALIL